ncbi:hypothetical protein [Mangrovivirga cuniculi]|uniref:DUF4878 domain-containing protein n=1 Tax=Mangrovivirga cuniculi TaxID=2715131 RepID=A0A4D7JRK0_9BACT|nr:hypothetical protein [Mangrovivirga cuniculi]QCK13545.1 hypothetical protein DCC35_01640 [Mangrovivirga cuniculi]
MKTRFLLLIITVLMVIGSVASCSSEENDTQPEDISVANVNTEKQDQGASNIESLATQLVSTLKQKNFPGYIDLLLSRDHHIEIAENIQSDSLKSQFLIKYDFRLQEQREKFNQITDLLVINNINLDNALINEMVVLEDTESSINKIMVSEVLIPISQNGKEYELRFFVIKNKGKFFLTSDINL